MNPQFTRNPENVPGLQQRSLKAGRKTFKQRRDSHEQVDSLQEIKENAASKRLSRSDGEKNDNESRIEPLSIPRIDESNLPKERRHEYNELSKLLSKINALQEKSFRLATEEIVQTSETQTKELHDTIDELKKELESERRNNEDLRQELAESKQYNQQVHEEKLLVKELFGLEVLSSRAVEEGIRYTCRNTGRRGQLEYQLLLDNFNFTFTPCLNPQHDGELMDYLPEYLTEEIIFTKEQGKLFSARIMKALQD
ncbi:chromosome segregation protein Pcs1 [Schizosaccharomyces cryophilus OY26]|uniref:Chromosome segregation protein Pcs1 n=1 Tax=Schizosaccharomyces cryophilus (strain OY26 / ATCC MYA-4695 / CBS 11777 / NBRC 106824 / NRRL Y48691) TaxID=653667 RepID=S9VVI1_SCHCR|nr:chromosome segregation protein Pcs1 [Schizosaccharomyces cryophilus OY26]EPY50174.1 chromosome segregation protein Pcs1 [Schizosaccharomyces cryophilus OY26]